MITSTTTTKLQNVMFFIRVLFPEAFDILRDKRQDHISDSLLNLLEDARCFYLKHLYWCISLLRDRQVPKLLSVYLRNQSFGQNFIYKIVSSLILKCLMSKL